MATLAEIRAKLLQQEQSKQGNKRGGDNAIYAHWNTPEQSTSIIRFLPDGNTNNDFFWLERQMINISFSGIKGHDESKPVTVKVPCVEMWEGMTCPIHKEIRPWFKDPNMEDMARKYWKKRSYLFQGLVVDSAFDEETVPENPIRRFTISPQIFKIIQSALMDPDFGDALPTDYDEGVDFRITKTTNGQYADYSTSNWARKTRSLDQVERDAIAEHGLYDLNDFLPKKPSEQELAVIFDMFEASVDGELYDPERFAEFYRPWGFDAPSSGASTRNDNQGSSNNAPESKPAAPEVKSETKESASPLGQADAKDILAAIKARKAT